PAWNTFRMQIQALNNFGYLKLSGSNDPVGVECMGAPANTLCQALGTGVATSTMCNGRTWSVGTCGSGIELSAQGVVCQCTNPGYISRPCIGNSNWGGINTD